MGSEKSVENATYQIDVLPAHHIYEHPSDEPFPEHIAELIGRMRSGRNSPGPSQDDVLQDAWLCELSQGAVESEVDDYFKDSILPKYNAKDILSRSSRLPMAEHTIPNITPSPTLLKIPKPISNPVPDILYGYSMDKAFP
jgi:hypothetical protein